MLIALSVSVVLAVLAAVVAFVRAAPLEASGAAAPEGTFSALDVPRGDPMLHGRLVVLQTLDGWDAFDIETGARRWSSPQCDRPAPSGATATREGSIVVVRCAEQLRGLDLDSGRTRWTIPLVEEPTMLRVGGGRIAIALDDRVLVADLHTGKRLYRWVAREPLDASIITTADDRSVYIGESRRVYALDRAGHVRWSKETIPSTIFAAGGRVLIRFQGGFELRDAATGELVRRGAVTGVETRRTMIVAMDGEVAVLASAEVPVVWAVSLRTLRLRWKSGGSWFAVADDESVAVRAGGSVRVLGLHDGRVRHRGSASALGVTVGDGRVATLEIDGLTTRVEVQRLPER